MSVTEAYVDYRLWQQGGGQGREKGEEAAVSEQNLVMGTDEPLQTTCES
ncbi:hypothetical protein TREES_T100014816 [Tupaia chinensis]|uniref:Uncharacterized protein n=1 Tax=Tupaia chinensis TaxID=246437 RepID=L9KTH0_TUPCH|nr:hypothetical protein TREES_T100014816 [Tupaia chinensis]